MKFGISQIWAETPAFIRKLKRSLNFFMSGAVAFMPLLARWLHTDIDTLSQISGLILLAINSFGVMFGIDPEKESAKSQNFEADSSNPDKPRGGG